MSETTAEPTTANRSDKTAEAQSVKDILRDAAAGLLMMSESDRPFTAFTWPAKKTGDAATAQNALQAAVSPAPSKITALTLSAFFAPMIEPKDWWRDEEKATAAQFQTLIDALKKNLAEPQAYRLEGASEIPVYILGKDDQGTWSGVRTVLVET